MKKTLLFLVLWAVIGFGMGRAMADDESDRVDDQTSRLNAREYDKITGRADPSDPQAYTPAYPAPAPDDQASPVEYPAPQDPSCTSGEATYRIIAGDVLQITVWKEEGLDQEVLVLPDGVITFPLVGSMEVANMTPEEAQGLIKQTLKKFIPDAAVTVSVKAALGHTVSVIGQVAKSGEFVMGHALTVMQALSQAGGLTPYADQNKVMILRRTGGVETSIPFPYDDVVEGDHLDKDIVLNPGDVVVVPTTNLF